MIDFIHKYGKAFCVVGLLMTLWLIWTIAGVVASRRYEKRLDEATKAGDAKAQAAQVKLVEANAARDQADSLKIELEARDKEISDLNNQLAAARAQTGRTRIKYVESKTNPFPAVTLSGDLAVDRQRICDGLKEVGIICR